VVLELRLPTERGFGLQSGGVLGSGACVEGLVELLLLRTRLLLLLLLGPIVSAGDENILVFASYDLTRVALAWSDGDQGGSLVAFDHLIRILWSLPRVLLGFRVLEVLFVDEIDLFIPQSQVLLLLLLSLVLN
jgi:hypothetical protein